MTNFRTLATEMLARLFARSDEYKKRLKSSPGQLDLFGGPRADIQKSVKFDPDKHPRAPKGDTAHHGGQFVPKDEAKADVSKPPEDEPAKVPPEPEKKPEPAASEEPEIPEEFYDTEFDTGEPVGEAAKPDLTEAVTAALVDAGLAEDDPRQEAERKSRAMDEQYAFARKSAIGNFGEDLKGSARHNRNEWRSLAQAEKDGTAQELVTRENLLKNEPHELSSTIEDATSLSHLAAHLAINAFPKEPGKYPENYDKYRSRYGGSLEATPADELRSQYYEAYQTLKSEAERLATSETNPANLVESLRKTVEGLIKKFRGTDAGIQNIHKDPYNPVANGLVDTYNRLYVSKYRDKATSVMARVKDFTSRLNKAYGQPSREMLERSTQHVLDVMEGSSFNATFGEVGKAVKRFDPSEAYVNHAIRKGGRMINTSTVEAGRKHMMDTVKLRGVQWGNYVSDDERQHHLTKSAEAFADLADAIGIPDSAISLGGKLGLAIGARGRAGARAHYEANGVNINLTRASGVGSLAHEWGHALDHYLGGFKSFLSDKDRANTPELATAMKKVTSAFRESGFSRRLEQVVEDRVKAGTMPKKALGYWGSTIEMFARTFERHVQNKLHEQDRENTYLTGLHKEGHPLWPNNEEMKQMEPALNELMGVVAKTFDPDGSKRAEQYAKRPLKSSPGQKDLFGGKSTSGPQKDLLSQKPKGDKKWTAEDEKKHPRDEGGKFTFLNAGTGERSGAVHDALDSHQNMDADMVGMMFNVVHPSQHGDLRKAIDAARPDLSDVTEKHEREHGAMGQKAKMETTELATSPAQWPHEMTIAEYKSRRGDNKESLRFHKSEVKRAISEGKSVPPDVLADYPDLKPTPQPNMVTTEDAAPAQPAANSLPGGKGDKTPEAALPTKEVAKGAKVETEHTSDQAKAKEIAKDHLTEDTGYYDKLADMEKKPKTPPAIPGQQRGLFNETATGQKKLFDFVPPSKAKSAAKPEEKTLADEVQPVKQVESLPGQKSLLDSATAALSKAGLHQGETTPVANVSTSGYSEGQTGTTSAPASSDAKGETMATATTWTPKPNTTKNRLITTGETKAVRDSLKAAGWKWMPLQLSWYLDVDDATADAIRNEETRVDALRKVKGTKKGTITKLEGHVVHQSPTYAPKTQPNTSVSDEYDVDAAGNFAAGARIPGSLDRI